MLKKNLKIGVLSSKLSESKTGFKLLILSLNLPFISFIDDRVSQESVVHLKHLKLGLVSSIPLLLCNIFYIILF